MFAYPASSSDSQQIPESLPVLSSGLHLESVLPFSLSLCKAWSFRLSIFSLVLIFPSVKIDRDAGCGAQSVFTVASRSVLSFGPWQVAEDLTFEIWRFLLLSIPHRDDAACPLMLGSFRTLRCFAMMSPF